MLSGAVQPIATPREPRVRCTVAAALRAGLHPDNKVTSPNGPSPRGWLSQWFVPPPMPLRHDAAGGEPILRVADHWQVLDRPALTQALAAQGDVGGDARRGWQREARGASAAEDGPAVHLLAMNPGRGADRGETFACTQRLPTRAVPGSRRWPAQPCGT